MLCQGAHPSAPTTVPIRPDEVEEMTSNSLSLLDNNIEITTASHSQSPSVPAMSYSVIDLAEPSESIRFVNITAPVYNIPDRPLRWKYVRVGGV